MKILNMRLRIFGVPKIALFLLGLLPLVVWAIFHLSGLTTHKEEARWALAIGVAVSAIFTYAFSRGIFRSRFAVYAALFIEICIELVRAVSDRDFTNLFLALIIFGLSLALAFWVEVKVTAAYLNPGVRWYEGDPKFVPHTDAQLSTSGKWVDARVCRIDRSGFFVFVDEPLEAAPKQAFDFKLRYRNQPIEGKVVVQARFFGEKQGLGLQFSPKDLYHLIQYTALVQRIKGEGL